MEDTATTTSNADNVGCAFCYLLLVKAVEAFFHFASSSEADTSSEC